MLSIEWYLNQQKKLQHKTAYRWFWKFWAIFSQAFLIGFGLYLLFTAQIFLFIVFVGTWVVARLIINEIIYLFYKKPRPYQRYGFKPITSWFFSFAHTKPDSFPSGHVAGLVAVSTLLFFFSPWVGFVGMVIALLSAAGRIILGYHFPIDVVAAMVIGLAWGYCAYSLVPYVLPLFL